MSMLHPTGGLPTWAGMSPQTSDDEKGYNLSGSHNGQPIWTPPKSGTPAKGAADAAPAAGEAAAGGAAEAGVLADLPILPIG